MHRLFENNEDEAKEEAHHKEKHESRGKEDHHAKDEKHAEHGEHAGHDDHGKTNPDLFANPLPHVLMLTAIVVGVATLGVALSITQVIFREFGTLEENEILEEIKSSGNDG